MKRIIFFAFLSLTACTSPADRWKALNEQQKATQADIDKRMMDRCYMNSLERGEQAARETSTFEEMMRRWRDLDDRELALHAAIGDPGC
jgi:hypothetical protein